MARKRRRRTRRETARDNPSYRSQPRRRLLRVILNRPPEPSPTFDPWRLTDVEDTRTWHPDGPVRNVRRISGVSADVEVPRSKRFPHKAPSSILRFHDPLRVIVCVRRRTRREVLFASRRNGRGNKKGRRTFNSEISCK